MPEQLTALLHDSFPSARSATLLSDAAGAVSARLLLVVLAAGVYHRLCLWCSLSLMSKLFDSMTAHLRGKLLASQGMIGN